MIQKGRMLPNLLGKGEYLEGRVTERRRKRGFREVWWNWVLAHRSTGGVRWDLHTGLLKISFA